jgi:ABC-type uncharacterized transport system permease subunit
MFKMVFTCVLPMILVANVPAKVMVQKLHSPGQLVLLVVMMFACAIASELGWRFAIRHYTSASS